MAVYKDPAGHYSSATNSKMSYVLFDSKKELDLLLKNVKIKGLIQHNVDYLTPSLICILIQTKCLLLSEKIIEICSHEKSNN